MNVASLERLQSVRTVVFEYAIGTIIECEDPERHIDTSQYKLKQRRGAKAAATTAMDTVQLFRYICGINVAFPMDVLVKSRLSTVTTTARANDVEVCPDAICDESPGNSHGPPPPTPPSSPSQDIECAQRSFDDDATTPSQDGVPSIIGSPFLNDDGVEPAPRAHSSPAMRSDCSTADYSIFTCSSTSLNMTQSPAPNCAQSNQHCCDHGRAILDLRCTIDHLHNHIYELEKAVDPKCDTSQPAPNQHRAPLEPKAPSANSSPNRNIFPSPPESRPPSADLAGDEPDSSAESMSLTGDLFNDILNMSTPPKGGISLNVRDGLSMTAQNDIQPAASQLSARDSDSTPAPDADSAAAAMKSDATPVQPATGPQRTYVQNELDSLRTMVIGLEHRMMDNEMTSTNNGETIEGLKHLPNSYDSLKKVVNVMRGDIIKNQKQIQRLRHQSKKDNDLVLNVETNNRFAVLADECTSDEPVQTSASKKNVAKKKQKKDTIKKTRIEKTSKPVMIKIVGASMVRGQGKLVSDKSTGVSACCFPCPGSTAEGNKRRLSGIVSKNDDAVVVLAGTNNVPRDDVGTCIRKINEVVREIRRHNKHGHLILSELPIRFVNVSLNTKIEKINVFIRHISSKSDKMHVLRLDHLFRSHFGRDGLHFSESGRTEFADAIKRLTQQCIPDRR